MGPRRTAGGAFALVAIGMAACSLADFTGYSKGDDVAPDGGSLADAGPSLDSGSSDDDSAVPATNDAGADGEAGADASTTFCERNADAGFFCEDFEGPNPLLDFSSTVTKNGTLVVDNGSMIADAPANANPSEVYGAISAKVIGATARLEFRVRPEQLNLTTSHSCQLAKFMFIGAQTYEVGIGVRGKDDPSVYTYEFTAGYYKEFGSLQPLNANGYTRFVLDVRLANGPRLDVDRDGIRVVNGVTLTPPFTQASIEAFIGVPYTQGGHGPWKFRFDDIVMGLP